MKDSGMMAESSLHGSKGRDDPQWKLWNLEFSQDESEDYPRVRKSRSPRRGKKPQKKSSDGNNKENNENKKKKSTDKKKSGRERQTKFKDCGDDNNDHNDHSISASGDISHSNNTALAECLHSSIQTTKMYSVSFGTVETREYERILDVNPWCNGSGPAFGLGWNYNVSEPVEVDSIHDDDDGTATKKVSLFSSSKNGDPDSPKKNKNKKSLTDYFNLKSSKKGGNNLKKSLFSSLSSTASSGGASVATRSKPLHLSPLSPAQREDLAVELGYTKVEIRKNVIKVLRAQKQREEDNLEAKQAQQRALALAKAAGVQE